MSSTSECTFSPHHVYAGDQDKSIDAYDRFSLVKECIKWLLHSVEVRSQVNEVNETDICFPTTAIVAMVPTQDSSSVGDNYENSADNQTICSPPSTLSSLEGTVNPYTDSIVHTIENNDNNESDVSSPANFQTADKVDENISTGNVNIQCETYQHTPQDTDALNNIIEENRIENTTHSDPIEPPLRNVGTSWGSYENSSCSNYHHIEGEMVSEPTNDDRESYERIWNKRKVDMEKQAEERAKKRFRDHEKEGKTLEDVINVSLKEYAEFHEMAHTVRLKFEEEKSKFLLSIQSMIANNVGTADRNLSRGTEPQFGFEYLLDDNGEDDTEAQHLQRSMQGHMQSTMPGHNAYQPLLFSAPKAGKGKPFTLPSRL